MFVGRGALLTQIHKASAQKRGAFDLRGSLGSGKTAIVQNLDENAPDFLPIALDMEEYNPGHPDEAGPSASVGAVQASFWQFSRLLVKLVKRTCADHVAARFEQEVTEAHNSQVAGRRVFSLEEAMVETRGELTPKDLADAWRESAGEVAKCFVAHWNAAENGKCRLLMLDNVDEIADQEVGAWLGALLPRLERTAVVLTRQLDGALPSFPENMVDSFLALDVPSLDEGEVGAYLNEKAPGRVSGDVAAKVHKITGGHPGTVSVVHDLLWGPGLGDETDPETMLRDLPSQATERVALLVERLVERLNDPAMLRALWAAAVPRRFDAALLKALLSDSPVPDDDLSRVFEAFGHFPFTEDVTPSDRLPTRSVLRIHPYVRNGLLDRMLRDGRDIESLHKHAATFHNDLLLGKGTNASIPYGDAFVYENPEWQRSKREWLYHRGHAKGDDARYEAVLETTRVFLEAFWWWGNYVHFDFCDQLVADLRHMVDHYGVPIESSSWAELGVLHHALQSFLQAYPPRSWKRNDADWKRVYDALLQVQNVCGLADRGLIRSDKQRKVGALLDVFLAHTWRYQAPQSPKADEYYRRAAAGFEQLEEDWSEAWVHSERAELRLERDQVDDELRDLWRRAATIAQPQLGQDSDGNVGEGEGEGEASSEPDEELTANLHRLRGDVCWRHGQHLRAATWYRRAVLHAYLFHDIGGPPDEYTLQFYVDIRARALNRLLELWTGGRTEEGLDCAEELARVQTETSFGEAPPARAELEAVLGEGSPLRLAEALFPRGPEVSDLDKKMSPFLTEFLRRREALDPDSVARGDLGDDEWP